MKTGAVFFYVFAFLVSFAFAQVVHGDLTTSNLMVRNGSQRVVAIDFGLASQQPLPEDKVSYECGSATCTLRRMLRGKGVSFFVRLLTSCGALFLPPMVIFR